MIAMSEARCDAVGLLLPWFAAGTLDAREQASVDSHVLHCERCRADLAAERRLAAAIVADPATADGGWIALDARLDRAERDAATRVASVPPRRSPRGSRRRARVVRALSTPAILRRVVGVQFAALLILGAITVLPQKRASTYRALGDGPVAGARQGNTLAMFRPSLSEASLRRALVRANARLVDGPTEAGAYLLDVPGGAGGPQIATLRAQDGVTMAEPIGEGTAE